MRLRVVVEEQNLSLLNQQFRIDDATVERLGNWASEHYREQLTVDDLADLSLIDEAKKADETLQKILGSKPAA